MGKLHEEIFEKTLDRAEKYHKFHDSRIKFISDEMMPRINHLKGTGYYIEANLLIAQVIESLVTLLILSYQSTISLALCFSKHDTILTIATDGNTYIKQTLGNLISELDKYCSDKKLLNMLKLYNKKIRTKFVHRLIDPATDLSTINSGANSDFKFSSAVIVMLVKSNKELGEEWGDRREQFIKNRPCNKG